MGDFVREINVNKITEVVAKLCIETNKILPNDLCALILKAEKEEEKELPKRIMGIICDNLSAAKKLDIPICQDTGLVVVFAEIGQEIHFTGGLFEDAVNKGVKKGYEEGLLRKSIVKDPLKNRENTGDNTPAIIHTRLVSGDKIKLTVSPKGFGSENMSALKMFLPSASKEDIIEFVVEQVIKAGGNPCPPIVLGIGIGSDFEGCAILAKKALVRSVSIRNSDTYYAEMENEILKRVNETDIGPQGFSGKCTALCVNIETAPTHIAGLPVAINVGCHITRHKTIEI